MNEQIEQRITQLNNGEIPSGYEKTEFGVFPCDWVKDKTFGDLFDFYGGLGKSRDELGDEGHAYLHYGDLHRGAFNVVSHEQYEQLPKYDVALKGTETYLMEDGDVAFLHASEASEGTSCAVLIDNPDNEPFIAGLHIIYGKSKDESLEKWYKQYITSSESVRKQFQRLAAGFKVYGVNRDTLPRIQVAYPKSTEEQSKIAEILMKWDEAIELQEQYIQTLLSMKITYVDKFFCAPGEEKTKFDLLYKTAGEGGTPDTKKQAYYDSEDVPFVKIEHLAEKYITKIDSYISNLGLQKSGAWLVPENCLIFSNGATIGEASINKIPVATKQGILGIVPSDVIDVEYFYYLVKSKYFLSKVKKITTKGTMCTAYLKDINRLSLFIHEKEDQIKIAKILSSIDCLIEDEKRKVDLLKKQRKALQQYLLNGIVRVK